jgi:hypothetical protein
MAGEHIEIFLDEGRKVAVVNKDDLHLPPLRCSMIGSVHTAAINRFAFLL